MSPSSSSGHVDPGEDDLTTAFRETQEEAGLTAEHLRVIDGFVQQLRYEVQGKPKEVLYWLAELRDPETELTLSDEHQDYRWAQLEDACTLAQYKDMQDTLRAAHQYLETWKHQQWEVCFGFFFNGVADSNVNGSLDYMQGNTF